VSGPWEDYAEDGPWSDYATPEAPPQRPLGQEIGRQLKLTGRIGAEAVGALPLAAMDAGVGIRNMFPGQNYELPSAMYSKALDQVFAPRESTAEKVVGVAGNMLLGSKLPVPGVKNPAPQGFMPSNPRLDAFAEARKAGYVAPPSTVNPTFANRATEGVAGKLTTAQMASARNQSTTNTLAQTELGLSGNAPLTKGAIKEVRQGALEAYKVIRGAGSMAKDPKFLSALDDIEANAAGANKSFPGLSKSPVADEIAALRDGDSFEADSAVDAIALLRQNADDAFRQGKGQAGTAYKKMAKALEDVIERNLKNSGKAGEQTLKQYRDARTLLAKTYSVEKAFNPRTGNIDATKLARQLDKGAPLSGNIRTAAEFAQAFPKAARDFNESLPGMSPLDFYASGGISAGSGNPLYLGLPFARLSARKALLSDPWQDLMIPKPYAPPEELAGSLAVGLGSVR
jgi:hypothetical protein